MDSSVLETSANPARPSVNQAHPVGRLEGCFRAPHCRGPCGRSDMRCLSSVAAEGVYFCGQSEPEGSINSVHLSQTPGLEIPPNNCGKTLEELASFGDKSQWEKPCEAS